MKKIITLILTAAVMFSCLSVFSISGAAETPVLKNDSSLVLSLDGEYVYGTRGAICADRLKAQFTEHTEVKSPDGQNLEGDAPVPSGSTVSTDGGSLSVLVSGDANRDGDITLTDVTATLKVIADWGTPVDLSAADVNSDGNISLGDVVLLLKYIAKWDVGLGLAKIVRDTHPVSAQNEDGGMRMWFEHSNTKLWQEDTEPTSESTGCSYVINAAKNEAEDCAMYIVADKDYDCIVPSVTDFTNCYGETVTAEVYSYFYVHMRKDMFDNESSEIYGPDAMIPSYVKQSETKSGVVIGKVKKNVSQGYMIKAVTTADTRAGLYEATVSLSSGTAEVKRAKVYLNVWNFTLNDADACKTSFGMEIWPIFIHYNLDSDTEKDKANEIFKKYYDFFLDNRINTTNTPYPAASDEYEEYLNNDRVRCFMLGAKKTRYGSGTDEEAVEQIKAEYEKLSQNPEWFDKGYFYYVDEPLPDNIVGKEGTIASIKTMYEFIQNIFPGGKQIVPLTADTEIVFPDNLFDYYSYVQLWCPRVWCFTEEKYRYYDEAYIFQDEEWEARNGDYIDNLNKHLISGDVAGNPIESWWYFAGGPWTPYVSFHAEDDGLAPRTAFWQQKQLGITGVLYFGVDCYGYMPYRNIDYRLGNGAHSYGNGILVYPGYYVGIEGPVGSLRVEYIRDGIEDYMYLVMIERLFGKDVADGFTKRISTDLFDYNESPEVLLGVREEMASMLELYYSDN